MYTGDDESINLFFWEGAVPVSACKSNRNTVKKRSGNLEWISKGMHTVT